MIKEGKRKQYSVGGLVCLGVGGMLIDFLQDKFLCQKAVPLMDEILILLLGLKNE